MGNPVPKVMPDPREIRVYPVPLGDRVTLAPPEPLAGLEAKAILATRVIPEHPELPDRPVLLAQLAEPARSVLPVLPVRPLLLAMVC